MKVKWMAQSLIQYISLFSFLFLYSHGSSLSSDGRYIVTKWLEPKNVYSLGGKGLHMKTVTYPLPGPSGEKTLEYTYQLKLSSNLFNILPAVKIAKYKVNMQCNEVGGLRIGTSGASLNGKLIKRIPFGQYKKIAPWTKIQFPSNFNLVPEMGPMILSQMTTHLTSLKTLIKDTEGNVAGPVFLWSTTRVTVDYTHLVYDSSGCREVSGSQKLSTGFGLIPDGAVMKFPNMTLEEDMLALAAFSQPITCKEVNSLVVWTAHKAKGTSMNETVTKGYYKGLKVMDAVSATEGRRTVYVGDELYKGDIKIYGQTVTPQKAEVTCGKIVTGTYDEIYVYHGEKCSCPFILSNVVKNYTLSVEKIHYRRTSGDRLRRSLEGSGCGKDSCAINGWQDCKKTCEVSHVPVAGWFINAVSGSTCQSSICPISHKEFQAMTNMTLQNHRLITLNMKQIQKETGAVAWNTRRVATLGYKTEKFSTEITQIVKKVSGIASLNTKMLYTNRKLENHIKNIETEILDVQRDGLKQTELSSSMLAKINTLDKFQQKLSLYMVKNLEQITRVQDLTISNSDLLRDGLEKILEGKQMQVDDKTFEDIASLSRAVLESQIMSMFNRIETELRKYTDESGILPLVKLTVTKNRRLYVNVLYPTNHLDGVKVGSEQDCILSSICIKGRLYKHKGLCILTSKGIVLYASSFKPMSTERGYLIEGMPYDKPMLVEDGECPIFVEYGKTLYFPGNSIYKGHKVPAGSMIENHEVTTVPSFRILGFGSRLTAKFMGFDPFAVKRSETVKGWGPTIMNVQNKIINRYVNVTSRNEWKRVSEYRNLLMDMQKSSLSRNKRSALLGRMKVIVGPLEPNMIDQREESEALKDIEGLRTLNEEIDRKLKETENQERGAGRHERSISDKDFQDMVDQMRAEILKNQKLADDLKKTNGNEEKLEEEEKQFEKMMKEESSKEYESLKKTILELKKDRLNHINKTLEEMKKDIEIMKEYKNETEKAERLEHELSDMVKQYEAANNSYYSYVKNLTIMSAEELERMKHEDEGYFREFQKMNESFWDYYHEAVRLENERMKDSGDTSSEDKGWLYGVITVIFAWLTLLSGLILKFHVCAEVLCDGELNTSSMDKVLIPLLMVSAMYTLTFFFIIYRLARNGTRDRFFLTLMSSVQYVAKSAVSNAPAIAMAGPSVNHGLNTETTPTQSVCDGKLACIDPSSKECLIAYSNYITGAVMYNGCFTVMSLAALLGVVRGKELVSPKSLALKGIHVDRIIAAAGISYLARCSKSVTPELDVFMLTLVLFSIKVMYYCSPLYNREKYALPILGHAYISGSVFFCYAVSIDLRSFDFASLVFALNLLGGAVVSVVMIWWKTADINLNAYLVDVLSATFAITIYFKYSLLSVFTSVGTLIYWMAILYIIYDITTKKNMEKHKLIVQILCYAIMALFVLPAALCFEVPTKAPTMKDTGNTSSLLPEVAKKLEIDLFNAILTMKQYEILLIFTLVLTTLMFILAFCRFFGDRKRYLNLMSNISMSVTDGYHVYCKGTCGLMDACVVSMDLNIAGYDDSIKSICAKVHNRHYKTAKFILECCPRALYLVSLSKRTGLAGDWDDIRKFTSFRKKMFKVFDIPDDSEYIVDKHSVKIKFGTGSLEMKLPIVEQTERLTADTFNEKAVCLCEMGYSNRIIDEDLSGESPA